MKLILAKEKGQHESVRAELQRAWERLELMIDKMGFRKRRIPVSTCAEIIADLESLGLKVKRSALRRTTAWFRRDRQGHDHGQR